ncbi:hypothetical protein AN641_03435 [Candidatus Epulonipiscioides gigas]|nr:hypothetical protein AN641_03435 [Epulopiscium sp. SCG-C07WGA-EpuloA2]
MAKLVDIFSIYIIIVLFCIGLYLYCVQSVYLKNVDNLNKESIFTKIMGIFYILVAILGVFIRIIY